MGKKKRWIISSPNVRNSVTGEEGDSAIVHNKEDLERRLKAARDAGVRVNVREAE